MHPMARPGRKSKATAPDLSDSKQGAPEAAGASFLLTDEAARAASPIPLLSPEVIDLLAEIEPDNGVARAVTLRLRFIPKRSERQSRRNGQHYDRHSEQKECVHPKTSCRSQRTVAGRGRLT